MHSFIKAGRPGEACQTSSFLVNSILTGVGWSGIGSFFQRYHCRSHFENFEHFMKEYKHALFLTNVSIQAYFALSEDESQRQYFEGDGVLFYALCL